MTGQNPLDFIPLNKSADQRSGGQVVSWINYWWKDRKGAAWGGRALKRLSPDDWFQLHTQERPRLWTPPPASMETVLEVFNEDCQAHPHIPNVFAIPRLITHLWRRWLSKDVNVLFTINMGPSFWPFSMHEPLIVLIVFTLDHVSNYRGPWVIRGSSTALEVQDHLEAGLKHTELHGCGKFQTWKGPCMECETPKRSGVGLFC